MGTTRFVPNDVFQAPLRCSMRLHSLVEQLCKCYWIIDETLTELMAPVLSLMDFTSLFYSKLFCVYVMVTFFTLLAYFRVRLSLNILENHTETIVTYKSCFFIH